ncbi:MAG: hypothetical protein JWP02_1588 [Acidimicrobiales bacterium]|nr:hypothetical protein [Acidimicrobiales bacterium]
MNLLGLLGAEGIKNPTIWYPTILGVLVVVAAVGLFCGSVYLLLATNLGARLGFLVAAAALSGFMVLLSSLWMTTASPLTTLRGRVPAWQVKTVQANPSSSNIPAVRDIESSKQKLDPALDAAEFSSVKAAIDAKVVTALPIGGEPLPAGTNDFANETAALRVKQANQARAKLIAGGATAAEAATAIPDPIAFAAPTEYQVVNVYETGGARPDFFQGKFTHTPKYAVAELCPVDTQRATAFGQRKPQAICDLNQPNFTVVVERDLGSVRVPPMIVFIVSSLLFLLSLLSLHWYEKDRNAAALARSAAPKQPAPTPTPANA